MITVTVEITGVSALLQNRFGMEAEAATGTRRVTVNRGTPREEAEKAAYRDDQGNCYFPGAAIARLLREAGAAHKQRGSRKSLKYIVPSAVLVPQDTIALHNGKPLHDFEVDSRPVTIPSTKGRIMRHRPRFEKWQATFVLEIDDDVLPPDMVQQLLTEGGRGIGIGDYRPERGGPFGRFMVTGWAAN